VAWRSRCRGCARAAAVGRVSERFRFIPGVRRVVSGGRDLSLVHHVHVLTFLLLVLVLLAEAGRVASRRDFRAPSAADLPSCMTAQSVGSERRFLSRPGDGGHRCSMSDADGWVAARAGGDAGDCAARSRRRLLSRAAVDDIEWVLADAASAKWDGNSNTVMFESRVPILLPMTTCARRCRGPCGARRRGVFFAFETRNPSVRGWEQWIPSNSFDTVDPSALRACRIRH